MTEPTGSVADGLVGMMNVFIDPATTAKRAPSKLSWLWPVLILCIGYALVSYLVLPYTLQLIDVKMAERNMPAEQLERAQSMTHTYTKFTSVIAPVFVIGFLALNTLLIKAMYSMMSVRARYHDVFALLAACSLIPLLQSFASYVVIRAKGDAITSPEQMAPPFGLDIVFQGAKGLLFGFLHFFSIFEIWYLIVLALGLAYLTHSSKAKAFVAITPAWVLPLIFALIGAAFQNK